MVQLPILDDILYNLQRQGRIVFYVSSAPPFHPTPPLTLPAGADAPEQMTAVSNYSTVLVRPRPRSPTPPRFFCSTFPTLRRSSRSRSRPRE